MATIHINAEIGDFSETVLMAGDPLRVKYISETFIDNSREVNNVRGMLGYTGFYKGKRISIMSHGMGIPSCCIYVKELITDFGVKKIIRLGSCGAISNDINIRDIIIAIGASTDSKMNRIRFKDNDFSAVADFHMIKYAIDAAKILGINVRIGNIFSSDFFYNPDIKILEILNKFGILGIEMEASGIYSIAAEYRIRALTMCTVSDHLKSKESLNYLERQKTFDKMIIVALESILLDNEC